MGIATDHQSIISNRGQQFVPDCSSISGIFLVLVRTLEAEGINCRHLFNPIGLNVAHANNPTARVPTSKMAKAWHLAEEQTDDPAIGITACEHVHAAVWYALSYVFFSSSSILSGLQRIIQYQRIIVTVASTKLRELPDAYVLSWQGHPLIAEQALDMYGGTIIQMCRQMTGTLFRPLRVSLCRGEPADGGRRHEAFFRAPVEFSANENALYLPKEACRKINLTGNEDLLNRNELLVNEYLKRVKSQEFINLVHSRVIESFNGNVVLEQQVAESMNLSQRSLQRKLHAHGTSFRSIMDNARKRFAMELIDETDLLISEIGFRLGYADTGNFSSAFKRWTGVSPSVYRNRQN